MATSRYSISTPTYTYPSVVVSLRSRTVSRGGTCFTSSLTRPAPLTVEPGPEPHGAAARTSQPRHTSNAGFVGVERSQPDHPGPIPRREPSLRSSAGAVESRPADMSTPGAGRSNAAIPTREKFRAGRSRRPAKTSRPCRAPTRDLPKEIGPVGHALSTAYRDYRRFFRQVGLVQHRRTAMEPTSFNPLCTRECVAYEGAY